MFPGDVCVCGGEAWRIMGWPPAPPTHQLVWSPLYPPGTAGRAGMEWASGWRGTYLRLSLGGS